MDNQEQDFGGLPVLKKSDVSSKSEVTSEDFGGLPVLKKKGLSLPSGEISSLTQLPSEFTSALKKGVNPNIPKEKEVVEEQVGNIDEGNHKAGKSETINGMTIPTNLPKQDANRYEQELKVNDAAINTLTDIYKQKGLKFDTSKPAAQKQIQDYIDKEKANDLVKVTGKDGKEYLTRGTGLFETAARTFGKSLKDPFESAQINFTNNPSDLADLLDKKAAEEPNIPENAPSKFTGYIGGLVGGLPKMAALLAIPYAGESAMVIEMYHNAMANQRKELYQRGIEEGLSREESAKKAMETAPTTAIPDAAMGYMMARGVGTGGKIAEEAAATAGKEILPEAAKKSFIAAAGKLGKEATAMGAMGAGGEVGRGLLGMQAGYNVTPEEIGNKALAGASEWALMHTAFKLMHVAPKAIASAAKNLLSHVPEPILEAEAETHPDGKQTVQEVHQFANTKTKVADFVPENKVASVTGLTEKTDNLKKDIADLEEKKKNVPAAVAAEIDNQINDKNKEVKFYDDQIKKVINSKDETGINEEVDDVTGEKFGAKKYVVDGKEVSQAEFEAMQGKPVGTKEIYFNQLHRTEKFDDDASVSTYLGHNKNEKNIFYTLPNKGIISYDEVIPNTNRFTITANAKNDTPADIKNAFERIEKYLPANHELLENKSISVDGLKVWDKFIKNKKYVKTGEINEVKITPIDKTNIFKDLKYTTENKWSGAKFENKGEVEALARVEKYLKDNNLDFKVKLDGDVIKVEVPVLKYNPTEEVKPIGKVEMVPVRRLSSEEPPMREGERIVTVTGKTEPERQNAIEQRKKQTSVKPQVIELNKLVQDANLFSKQNKNYKKSSQGLQELNSLRTRVRDMAAKYPEFAGLELQKEKIVKPSTTKGAMGKMNVKRAVRYNSKAEGDAIIEENGKVLTDRDKNIQDIFQEFNDSNIFLDFKQDTGIRMSEAQLEATIQDILDGIPSKRANRYLNELEAAIAKDEIPLYDKTTGEQGVSLEMLREATGIKKEAIGEPMDEKSLMKFLDGESKLTPDEQIELTDNIDNLIHEYEPEFEPKPKAGAKAEIQPVEAKPKEGITPEAEPITGAEKPKPEAAERGIEDVPKNEKRKLLNSNFEKLLNNEDFYKEFKIKSKCL